MHLSDERQTGGEQYNAVRGPPVVSCFAGTCRENHISLILLFLSSRLTSGRARILFRARRVGGSETLPGAAAIEEIPVVGDWEKEVAEKVMKCCGREQNSVCPRGTTHNPASLLSLSIYYIRSKD